MPILYFQLLIAVVMASPRKGISLNLGHEEQIIYHMMPTPYSGLQDDVVSAVKSEDSHDINRQDVSPIGQEVVMVPYPVTGIQDSDNQEILHIVTPDQHGDLDTGDTRIVLLRMDKETDEPITDGQVLYLNPGEYIVDDSALNYGNTGNVDGNVIANIEVLTSNNEDEYAAKSIIQSCGTQAEQGSPTVHDHRVYNPVDHTYDHVQDIPTFVTGTSVCSLCGKGFDSSFKLRQHMLIHSDIKPYECVVCSKTFALKTYLSKHIQTHTREKKHACEQCGKLFAFKHYLKEHMLHHIGSYVCEVCNVEFTSRSLLKKHWHSHNANDKNFACDICGKGFTMEKSLKMHMHTHRDGRPEKPVRVPKKTSVPRKRNKRPKKTAPNKSTGKTDQKNCIAEDQAISIENQFVESGGDRYLLDGQMSTDSELLTTKPMEHVLIGAPSTESFVTTGDLYQQEMINKDTLGITAENGSLNGPSSESSTTVHKKAHICTSCVKVFTSKKALRLHELVHTVSCSECNKKFTSTQSLDEHMLTHRSIHVCMKCNRSYQDYRRLKRHLLLHEQKPHSCTKCNGMFKDTSDFEEHLLSHDSSSALYICHICKKGFSLPYKLKIHMRYHMGDLCHVCVECGKKFSHDNALAKHMLIHTKDSKFTCDSCGIRFRYQSHLSRHMLAQCGKRPYLCSLCNKKFARHDDLTKHMKSHADDNRQSCPVCNKIFHSNVKLQHHLLVHNEQTIHQCIICSSQFEDQYQLKEHMKVHSADLSCPHCNKTFKQLNHLKRHVVLHTGDRPYVCDECGKAFANTSTLRMHKMTHSSGQSIICPICDKCFDVPRLLKNHMAVHGDTVHPCTSCDKFFRNSWALMRHTLTHEKQQPYACSMCSDVFTSNGLLKRHLSWRHNCEICDRQFADTTILRTHKQTHKEYQMFCTVCNKSFMLESQLRRHMIIHREKVFSCSFCDKSYVTHWKRIIHEKTHSRKQSRDKKAVILDHAEDTKPHICKICKKAFTSNSDFQEHVELHVKRPFSCNECGSCFTKTSNLRKHVLTHKKFKSYTYSCHVCNIDFKDSDSLKLHVITHDEQQSCDVDIQRPKTMVTTPIICPECKKSFKDTIELKSHLVTHDIYRKVLVQHKHSIHSAPRT